MINENEKFFQYLGVSPKESRVLLDLLELGSAQVTTLGKKTGMPRTSLYPLLEKLLARGFVQRVHVRNHEEWEAIDPKALYESARASLRKFGEFLPELEKIKGRLSGRPNKISDVMFYRGRAGLKKVYWEALKQSKGSRIYSIESSQSIAAKMNYFNMDEGRSWQRTFNKSGIILETVFGENGLESFKRLDARDLRDYTNRLIVTNMIPDEMLDFDADIMCYGESLAIILVSRDAVIVIHNDEVARTFKFLFRIIQQFGKKFDLNAYVRNLLAEQIRKTR